MRCSARTRIYLSNGNTMKKTFKIIASLSVLTLGALSVNAQAADVNPWQDCGIGSMVFPDNGTASAISNVIWDLGTTAVTSATASEDTCGSDRVKTAQFIDETYNNLEEDLVKGEGTHLNALANMMSCSANAQTQIRTELAGKLVSADFNTATKSAKAETLFTIAESACSTNS